MALVDNLVAYYSLADVNDAHSSNHLTNNNTATFVAGLVGNAVNLVAASIQYLSIADNAALSMGDIDFTIAAWVRLASKTTHRQIIDKGSVTSGTNPNNEYALNYIQSIDRFRFAVINSSDTAGLIAADNFGVPTTATWYFVVAWHDSVNNLIGISVNAGTANTTAWTTGVKDSTQPFLIGGGSSLPMDGRIDEVGIWKRVLSGAEITELYNGGTGRNYAYIAANYKIDATLGAYTLTGVAASLLAARRLTAEAGSYTLNGQTASLLAVRRLTAEAGAYTLSGQAVSLLISRLLAAESGTYILNGYDVELLASRLLAAEAGSYTLSGQAVSLIAQRIMLAGAGAYVLTGQPASFLLSRVLTAERGSYVLNGQAVTLLYSGAEPVITPNSRIYVIPVEDRVYVILEENRTFVVH